MSYIDLTSGKKTFLVTTSIVRDGIAYMGPDVKVNARNAEHAKTVVQEQGMQVNKHFPPREVRTR